MDTLTRLRDLRGDAHEPTSEALERGRSALRDRVGRESRLAPTGRRRIALISLVGGLAAAVALAVALWPNGSPPAAASVLQEAALATVQQVDPVVGPGEYLLLDSTQVSLVAVGTPDGETSVWLERADNRVYIPSDRSAEWVWERDESTIDKLFDPSDRALAESVRRTQDAEIVRAANGTWYSTTGEYSPAAIAALPRDPDALLDELYAIAGDSGASRDGQAFETAIEILRSGLADGALRAAVYEAAAQIPGVVITADSTTVDGRRGVAIGRLETISGVRRELVVDPQSGLFLGVRAVLVDGTRYGLPGGTVIEWSSVVTTVVATAP